MYKIGSRIFFCKKPDNRKLTGTGIIVGGNYKTGYFVLPDGKQKSIQIPQTCIIKLISEPKIEQQSTILSLFD